MLVPSEGGPQPVTEGCGTWVEGERSFQDTEELLNCRPRQLEAFQIIRYQAWSLSRHRYGQAGEFFAPHGDYSSNGVRSSAGFVDCARLVATSTRSKTEMSMLLGHTLCVPQ